MKNLRELAKAYAQNTIDLETYRKSRSALIRSICAGQTDAKKHEYLAPLQPMPDEVMDDTTENMITQISSPGGKPPVAPSAKISGEQAQRSQTKKPKKKSKPKSAPPPVYISPGLLDRKYFVFGIATIIVLCVVTLVILMLPVTDDEPPVEIPIQVAESSAGQLLITDFIAQRNWTQKNLEVFVASWRQLSDQEQTVASTSPEMKRLTNTVYQQLLDERALLSLGDVENAVANQRSLVNFAEQLGINDDRLTVLEPANTSDAKSEEAGETTTSKIMEENIIAANSVNPSITETETESAPLADVVMADEDLNGSLTDEVAAQQGTAKIAVETIAATETPINESLTAPDAQSEIESAEKSSQQVETKTTTQTNSDRAACNTSLLKSRKPFCRDKIDGIAYGPTMVVIPAGRFTMGGKLNDEQPAHTVNIKTPFALSVHEISFAEYDEFCQSTKQACPKQPWSGKDYPVVNVTHADALAYVEWLTQKTGQSYRLPSEAEWEYAARAGTKTEYPYGSEILITNAVFSDVRDLSAPLTTSDRSINRNKFRLYHMVGNVREWVADTWHAGYAGAPDDGGARIEKGQNLFVVRGGSYADSAEALRSGAREKLAAADNFTGFRVLQELSE